MPSKRTYVAIYIQEQTYASDRFRKVKKKYGTFEEVVEYFNKILDDTSGATQYILLTELQAKTLKDKLSGVV